MERKVGRWMEDRVVRRPFKDWCLIMMRMSAWMDKRSERVHGIRLSKVSCPGLASALRFRVLAGRADGKWKG